MDASRRTNSQAEYAGSIPVIGSTKGLLEGYLIEIFSHVTLFLTVV